MIRFLFPLLFLAGCSTININTPQPNLQSINAGQPTCTFDCHVIHNSTQSIGDGDVTGPTVSTTRKTVPRDIPTPPMVP